MRKTKQEIAALPLWMQHLFRDGHQIGPGRRTLLTDYKRIRSNKYPRPHQGPQECERRQRQMGVVS